MTLKASTLAILGIPPEGRTERLRADRLARVVLASASGAQSVSELQRASGMSRGRTHVALQDAIEAGFIIDLADQANKKKGTDERPNPRYSTSRPVLRIVASDLQTVDGDRARVR